MEEPIISTREASFTTYLIAFLITGAIFATAFYLNDYFNSRRLDSIRTIQDNLSTDILSTETQFDLLSEHSCEGITENTALPTSLLDLQQKITYMESRSENSKEEFLSLKRLYSLMEIKDYLLMKRLAARCALNPVFILYFYSSNGECENCEPQGYVLTALQKKYPQVRIYSFDYDLDVGGLKTLIAVSPLKRDLPALLINGKAYYGLQTIESIEKAIPALQKMGTSTTANLKSK